MRSLSDFIRSTRAVVLKFSKSRETDLTKTVFRIEEELSETVLGRKLPLNFQKQEGRVPFPNCPRSRHHWVDGTAEVETSSFTTSGAANFVVG